MTIDQLYSFAVLAETLNYTKAAEILFISQPTLSRQILLLENEFQTQLFVRTYKSLTLSPSGEAFLEETKRILLDIDRLHERVLQMKEGAGGTLVCAAIGIFYPELRDLLSGFVSDNKDIRFNMMQKSKDQMRDALLDFSADFGICLSFEIYPEDPINYVALRRENFKLLVSKKHPLANRKSVSVSELLNENLVLVGSEDNHFIRELWTNLSVKSSNIKKQIKDPNSVDSIMLNVEIGAYSTILPAPLASSRGREIATLEIEDFDSSFDIVLAWPKENKNPALKRFLDYFGENFKPSNRIFN